MSTLSVAIVGPGEGASDDVIADAEAVARLVAQRGWVTLSGGRDAGVMAAAARGASAAGGLVIGILPGIDRSGAARDLSVALPTGLGEARNAVITTSADAVIVCGINAGTASEIALAVRSRKPVVLIRPDKGTMQFIRRIAVDAAVTEVQRPNDAVKWIEETCAARERSLP